MKAVITINDTSKEAVKKLFEILKDNKNGYCFFEDDCSKAKYDCKKCLSNHISVEYLETLRDLSFGAVFKIKNEKSPIYKKCQDSIGNIVCVNLDKNLILAVNEIPLDCAVIEEGAKNEYEN